MVRPGSWRVRLRGTRGQALLETAFVLPLVLLISVSMFEFARAYQAWQILTNAAREGARVAVLPSASSATVTSRVRQYIQAGKLPNFASAVITVNSNTPMPMGTGTVSSSLVTVDYPFDFIVLNPVAQLVVGGSNLGAPITMRASAQMRNETIY